MENMIAATDWANVAIYGVMTIILIPAMIKLAELIFAKTDFDADTNYRRASRRRNNPAVGRMARRGNRLHHQ